MVYLLIRFTAKEVIYMRYYKLRQKIYPIPPNMDIIDEKQQTGSIITTTQYPIIQWYKKLPDPTIADAICDRLIHNAYKFDLGGDTMRKKVKNPTKNDRK